jgi:hypothetical protein
MPFDGIEYGDAALTLPYAYHPDAPMTGEALGNALRAAYYGARAGGSRIVLQQNYHFNDRQAPDAYVNIWTFSSASRVRIAECTVKIPEEATHLRAHVLYAATAASNATVAHRIVCGANTGTERTDTIPGTGAGSVFLPATDPGAITAATTEIEVSLAGLTLTGNLLVYVEALSGTLYYYRPVHIGVYWEVRG